MTSTVLSFLASNLVGITSLVMAVIAVANIGAQRRKLTAEATRSGVDSAAVLSNSALAIVERYETENARLRARLAIYEPNL